MAKRKRSTVATAKETPIPLSDEPIQSFDSEKPTAILDEPDSTTKPPKKKRAKPDNIVQPKSKVLDVKIKDGVEGLGDPEAEGEELADEEELKEALSRPPPVNSDYLPLPWKGRLGYVRS
jgi:hypothetical protein